MTDSSRRRSDKDPQAPGGRRAADAFNSDANAPGGRRVTDSQPRPWWHRMVRENWYRDVWLLVISVLSVMTIVVGARQNADRIDDVQASREEAFKATCENVNQNNADATKALMEAPPRANVDKDVVKLLIDQLAPYTPDCAALARERVKTP